MSKKINNICSDEQIRELKIGVIGPACTGKTSLINRFVRNEFNTISLPTTSIDKDYKIINYKNMKLKLQIFDTAGQERFLAIGKTYYRQCHCILIVYSVDDIKSYNITMREFFKQIYSCVDPEKVGIVIVGNKCDINENKRTVSREFGESLGEDEGFPYIETSAKENINIEQSFIKVIDEFYRKNSGDDFSHFTERTQISQLTDRTDRTIQSVIETQCFNSDSPGLINLNENQYKKTQSGCCMSDHFSSCCKECNQSGKTNGQNFNVSDIE